MIQRHIAQYGGTTIERGFCSDCNTTALILDGRLQCCDKEIEKEENLPIYTLSLSQYKRKSLKAKVKKIILSFQGNKCLYCGVKLTMKTARFDHVIPFVHVGDASHNIVATCDRCNQHKSDKVFDSLLDVMVYMRSIPR